MIRALSLTGPLRSGVTQPLLQRWQSLRQHLCTHWQSLSTGYPRVCLLLTAVLVLPGLCWLLLFPGLVMVAVVGMALALAPMPDVAWSALAAWLFTGAAAALVCYRGYRFRPALPAGRAVNPATDPALWQLVAELSRHYRGIRVDRILVTRDFSVELVCTPRTVLPVPSINTLMIGQPLLQVCSVKQFQCLLARRLGQFSQRYNRLGNILVRLRDTWSCYADAAQSGGAGFQPVSWFFRVYSPFFRSIAAPVTQLDELAADRYAMDLFSDEEVLDTLVTYMVCRHFLAEKYWPVFRRFAARSAQVADRLHAGMATQLQHGLPADRLAHWLADTLASDSPCGDDVPSLARRIENIGFASARMSPLSANPAAALYLREIEVTTAP